MLEDAEYTYSYTTNGQLAQKVSRVNGDKTEYAWNVEGKVTQTTVKKSDNSIKSQIINKYDSFGRRIQKNDVRFVYDGESIIAEFGADNSVKALYLHGAGIDEPLAMVRDIDGDGEFTEKEVFFFSKDHLNSVHDLTDSQGKPVQRYNYTAYGKTKIEKTNLDRDAKLVNNPFAYTSREWEQESGDYYYRARYYDPGTGRFLSEDPIGFNGGDENLYRYVSNNPVYYNDPSGLATCSYSVTTQVMRCTGNNGQTYTFSGFVSGNGRHQNNPSSSCVSNQGPLPTGLYVWGGQGSSPSRRNLIPNASNNMCGRSNFQTHACPNQSTCSNGCIAGNVRELNILIDSEPGSTLTVTD